MSAARHKVELHDLSLEYGDGNGRRTAALEHVTLSVEAGQFVCLVGPSGCGKTTLLRIVAGLLQPTGGCVRVDDVAVTQPTSRCVLIFQQDATLPWLSVAENIRFGLRARPTECNGSHGAIQRGLRWLGVGGRSSGSGPQADALVDYYLKLAHLDGFEHAYPRELSGGMKQRLEIARALAAAPDVLLMDEPFGALDCLTRSQLRAELLDIHATEHKTILFVTHDVDEALQLADRIVVFGPRPAAVRGILTIDSARPRDLDSATYRAVRKEVMALLSTSPPQDRTASACDPGVPAGRQHNDFSSAEKRHAQQVRYGEAPDTVA
jgi:NitT/TauT family transport system ATP-binding protein